MPNKKQESQDNAKAAGLRSSIVNCEKEIKEIKENPYRSFPILVQIALQSIGLVAPKKPQKDKDQDAKLDDNEQEQDNLDALQDDAYPNIPRFVLDNAQTTIADIKLDIVEMEQELEEIMERQKAAEEGEQEEDDQEQDIDRKTSEKDSEPVETPRYWEQFVTKKLAKEKVGTSQDSVARG